MKLRCVAKLLCQEFLLFQINILLAYSHVTGVMAILTLEDESDVFGRHTRANGHPITSAVHRKTGISLTPLQRPHILANEV